MSYLKDFEGELRERVETCVAEGDVGGVDEVVKFVKTKVLESWKNGIDAGKKRAGTPRKNRTRSRS